MIVQRPVDLLDVADPQTVSANYLCGHYPRDIEDVQVPFLHTDLDQFALNSSTPSNFPSTTTTATPYSTHGGQTTSNVWMNGGTMGQM